MTEEAERDGLADFKLPSPDVGAVAFNEALRQHINDLVLAEARRIEERYGYNRDPNTAQSIAARPLDREAIIRAQRELAEFQELTARAFAKFFIPEPIFIAKDQIDAPSPTSTGGGDE